MSEVEDKLRKGLKSNRRGVIFWVIIFTAITIILYISIFSQNRVDTDGEAEVTKIDSLTCKSESYLYPFFVFDESDKKEFKIIATFQEDKIRSISLQQVLYYSDAELISKSETMNHASMNEHYSEDGMEPDSLGASYASLHDGFRFGIYSDSDKLNETNSKYFLLDKAGSYDYNRIKQVYAGLGLSCGER